MCVTSFLKKWVLPVAIVCIAIGLHPACGRPPSEQPAHSPTSTVTASPSAAKQPKTDSPTPAVETPEPATEPVVEAPATEPEESAGGDQVEFEGVLTLTDANFAEVTAKGVVLVDMWSRRCPPCLMQGPIVDRVAEKFAGRATVGKLNVDQHRKTPGKFGLEYIPTLIIFREGREVKRFVGLQQEETLASALEKALK